MGYVLCPQSRDVIYRVAMETQLLEKKKPKLWTRKGLQALGDLMLAARERLKLSQRGVSALIEERTDCYVSDKSLSDIERGNKEPKWNTLAIIAAAEFVLKPDGKPYTVEELSAIACEQLGEFSSKMPIGLMNGEYMTHLRLRDYLIARIDEAGGVANVLDAIMRDEYKVAVAEFIAGNQTELRYPLLANLIFVLRRLGVSASLDEALAIQQNPDHDHNNPNGICDRDQGNPTCC